MKIMFFHRLSIFAVALVATLGSLYFSEVMFFIPCTLCWYQRILMYPIVALSVVGLFFPARVGAAFIFPLSLLGFGIAGFHVLLEREFLGVSSNACSDSLCSIIWVNYFNIFTIPTLSLIAFSLINVLVFSIFLKSK